MTGIMNLASGRSIVNADDPAKARRSRAFYCIFPGRWSWPENGSLSDAIFFTLGMVMMAALSAISAERANAQAAIDVTNLDFAFPPNRNPTSAMMSAGASAAIADSALAALEGVNLDEFPTGRLRTTWHDGLRLDNPPGGTTGPITAREAAVFGSRSVNVPVGDGNLRLGLFGGYSSLEAEFAFSGKAGVDAYYIGGSGTYSLGSWYVTPAFTGILGQTELSGPVQASYDIFGYASSLSAGRTFALYDARGSTPIKLNIKSGIFYRDLSGNEFTYAGLSEIPGLKGWNALASAKLYGEIQRAPEEVVRPYVSVGLNEQLSYDNFVYSAGKKLTYSQDDTLGLAEIGFDYAFPNFSFSGAVYGEMAQDRATLGGKIGIKYLFN